MTSETRGGGSRRRPYRPGDDIRILLLSESPPGLSPNGNRLIREFIKSYHPYLCVVLGEKGSRSSEKHDPHTLVVNPGLVAEDSAAWIEIVEREVEMLDF